MCKVKLRIQGNIAPEKKFFQQESRQFLRNWEKLLTHNQWVLQTVSGVQMEFTTKQLSFFNHNGGTLTRDYCKRK